MKRSKRMQSVLKIAKMKADKGARAYAYIAGQLQQEHNKLSELSQYKEEYAENLRQESSAGISGQRLRSMQGFIANLDMAISQQKLQIENVKVQVKTVKEQWMALRAKYRSMEKLVDNFRLDELKAELKAEQKEMDELAGRFTDRLPF